MDTSFKYLCKFAKEGSPEMTLCMKIFFNIVNITFFPQEILHQYTNKSYDVSKNQNIETPD